MKSVERSVEDLYIDDLDYVNELLKTFLQNCGVKIKNKSLYSMVGQLDDIIAVKKDKKYYSLELDENGYIINFTPMDGIIEQQELPEDFKRGYYKYDSSTGSFYIDEKKKLEWR